MSLADHLRKYRNKALVAHYSRKRFGPGAVNIANARHVALFPSCGIAYNRLKKNANSSTMAALYYLEHGVSIHSDQAKRATRNMTTASLAEVSRLDQMHSVVILRDPFSRVLSAFLNKFAKPAYQIRHYDFELNAKGFLEFLVWLENGALKINAHWAPQTTSLFAAPDCFDTVLRYEDYPKCFLEFLDQRGFDLTSELKEIFNTMQIQTRTHATNRLNSFYCERAEDIVRRLYTEDFRLLGYSDNLNRQPLEPPEAHARAMFLQRVSD